jgi:hypothetical protein
MSNSFAILRIAKLKSFGNIGASLSHTYRTRETPNADPSLNADNDHSHKTPDEVMQTLKERLPEKRRKDAVLCLEFFVGGSPEWFKGHTRDQQDAYLKDSLAWLEKRHGKENIVGWSIHRDESTPHLVAYVVPIDEKGKLNAKHWTGGATTLSKMQTEFAKDIGLKHGLQRGIEGSKAHHQTIKSFYAQIEQPSQHLTIKPEDVEAKVINKGFFTNTYEAPEMIATRITQTVQKAYAPDVEKAKLATLKANRADQMERTAKSLSNQKDEILDRLNKMAIRLAPILELAVLAKEEFINLMHQTQQRVKDIKLERAKEEKEKKLARDELSKSRSKDRGYSR